MNFWTWFKGLFSNKDKIISIIDSAKVFVEKALPIVEAINNQVKPFLAGSEATKYALLSSFLLKYSGNIKGVASTTEALLKLPNADLLFNLALEILKLAAPTNTSLSVLRLAVELAYNLYKASQKA